MLDLIKNSSVRIKTAFILLFVFIGVSLIDTLFIIWLFLGVFLAFAVSEAIKLFGVDGSDESIVYKFTGITWLVAYFYNDPIDLIFVAIVVFGSILAYTKSINKKVILPILYPLASFLFLLALYNEFGIKSLWWILFVVGSTDVGAYYVGSYMGKTQFCPTSPNKTVEGLFGGVALAAILGPIFAISSVGYFSALIISVIVAISAIFGDLFESYLKREANVKDSGDILPGHGGVLDRTDGFLFGAVIMYVVLKAFS